PFLGPSGEHVPWECGRFFVRKLDMSLRARTGARHMSLV
ncbi:hypothetical protein ABH924_004669, partial [Arthrobacter sp. GAS37]